MLAATTAANVAGQMVWYPILPLVFRDLGATDFQVSLAYGLMVVAAALGQLPGGLLSDRVGRKPLVALPTFVIAAAVLGAGLAPSWTWLALAIIIQSAGSAMQVAGFVSIAAESVPPERQGEAFAYLELFASLGIGVGPAIGALLLPRLPVWSLFAGSSGIFLVSAAIRTVYLRETLRGTGRVAGLRAATWTAAPTGAGRAAGAPDDDCSAPNRDCDGPVVEPRPASRFSPADLFRDRLLWLTVAAIALLAGANLTLYGPFVPLYAHDIIGLARQQVDVLFAAGPLVAAASGLAMGRFVARKGGGAAMAWGFGGMGAACAGLLVAPSFGWAIAAVAVAAVGLQLAFVGYDTLRAEATSRESRGRVVGTLGAIGSGAGAAALPIVGRLAGGFGPGLALYLGVALCAVGMVAAVKASSKGRPAPPGVRPLIGRRSRA